MVLLGLFTIIIFMLMLIVGTIILAELGIFVLSYFDIVIGVIVLVLICKFLIKAIEKHFANKES